MPYLGGLVGPKKITMAMFRDNFGSPSEDRLSARLFDENGEFSQFRLRLP